MSIYNRTVENLTTADLDKLLAANAVENIRLEFKSQPVDSDGWTQKLSAFANTHGGYVILGAQEHSKGRLAGFPGVDEDQGLAAKLTDICYTRIWPIVQPVVSGAISAPGSPGKYCYVIFVPESQEAPHFLNGRRGVYVRTAERGQRYEPKLASYNELVHLMGRREQAVRRKQEIHERARERFDRLLKDRTGRVDHSDRTGGALLEVFACPSYPTAPIIQQGELLPYIQNNRLKWRMGQFPVMHEQLSQQNSALVIRAAISFSLLEVGVFGSVCLSVEVGVTLTGMALT